MKYKKNELCSYFNLVPRPFSAFKYERKCILVSKSQKASGNEIEVNKIFSRDILNTGDHFQLTG